MKTKNKKLIKIIKIVLIIISILVIEFLNILNSVQAANISSANLYSDGECGTLLKYKGIDVKVTYVKYDDQNGISYPAYCLDKNLPGVTEENPYTVSIENAINDVGLWRRIINGFPYKSYAELGCANEQEAFTATKQAIYCYIHENNPEDYEAIGEAGQRTLNALYTIVENAEKSTQTKVSNTITINKKEGEWKQDEKDEKYISKTYTVLADAKIENYKIKVEKEIPEGLKITNQDNIEKEEFLANEQFKILIPIKSLKNKGDFQIKIESKIETKPVLYGKAPDSSYQDYAITVATYEDAQGSAKDEYLKNDTKIIIKKQDESSKILLEGVEFELLDENKNVIQNNLKTDKEGRITIENIIPGKYFLKETKTIDGYILNDELIEVETILNQTTVVTINNKKEEKPKYETKIEAKTINTKKLPVTGM